MNRKSGILLSAFLLFAGIGWAQQNQTQNFTLKEAVDYAKKNSYTLKNSQLDVMAMQKKVNEIFALGLPQINASANIINNIQIPTQVLPNFLKPILGGGPDYIQAQFGNRYTSNMTISANQLLFDGTFLLGVKASKEFVNLAQMNASRTEIETEVNVSKAYYLVLLLEANEGMMNKNVTSLEKTKSDLEQIFKNGFIEKVDVDRITLQLSNLKVQRDKIHDQKILSEMVLKLQMGLSVNDPIALTDNLEKLFQSTGITAVEEKINFDNRVEYRMLKQQLHLNQLDKKRYQIGYYPSLVAFANHQQNTFASEGKFNELYDKLYPGTTIGLSLNVPIFDGFRKHAQSQQAIIGITKTENDIKNFENVMHQQAFMARANFLRSSQQLEIQKGNLKLAEQIYERMEVKYKNGVGSSLELTSAQTDLETARTNYLNGVFDYFVAELELKKALGTIK